MAKEYRFWLLDRVSDYRMDLFAACCWKDDTDARIAEVKTTYSDIINRIKAYAPKFD